MFNVFRQIVVREFRQRFRLLGIKASLRERPTIGSEAFGMGPFEQFQHLAETVTGGVIENCGHWVIDEQPGRVLEDLGEFLRQ